MASEHKPQKERLNIERAIERIEWMHYLGTKTFPHDAGWDEGCELCNAEAEVRETLLAARRLEEQLQTAEGTSEVLASHLAAASEKITGLEEQLETADLAAWLLAVDFAPELKIVNPKILKDEYLDRARKKLSNPASTPEAREDDRDDA